MFFMEDSRAMNFDYVYTVLKLVLCSSVTISYQEEKLHVPLYSSGILVISDMRKILLNTGDTKNILVYAMYFNTYFGMC